MMRMKRRRKKKRKKLFASISVPAFAMSLKLNVTISNNFAKFFVNAGDDVTSFLWKSLELF